MRTLGIVLAFIGILMMVYTGFNYVRIKKVVDIVPLQINKKENHPVQWSPIIGGVLLIGGILLIANNKNVNKCQVDPLFSIFFSASCSMAALPSADTGAAVLPSSSSCNKFSFSFLTLITDYTRKLNH